MWQYHCAAGMYYNTSIVGLCKDILVHRFHHWSHGEGWVD